MSTTQTSRDPCPSSEGAGRCARQDGAARIVAGLLTLTCAIIAAFPVGCSGKPGKGGGGVRGLLMGRACIDWSEGFSEGLGRIIVDGRRGYVDTAGKVVIQPQFELAWDFSDGRAMIGSGGKRGYINSKGEVVIPVQYDGALSFREGLAAVKTDGKWGFIGPAGKFCITPRYEEASDYFSEGLAPVKLDGKYGYIDRKGVFVVEPTYDCAISFSAGLGGVRLGPYWGYVDRTGQVKLPIRFGSVSRFQEQPGYALVNVTGKTVLSPGAGDTGICGIGKQRFIDRQGKVAFEPGPRTQFMPGFSEDGLAIGMSENGLGRLTYGYVDTKGKWIIPRRFQGAQWFSEGMAAVKLRGRWGYIDKSGRFVIQPTFDQAGRFQQGLARVVAEGKAGYIDRSGRYIWRSNEAGNWKGVVRSNPVNR